MLYMSGKGTDKNVDNFQKRLEIMTLNHQKQTCYSKVYKKANVF